MANVFYTECFETWDGTEGGKGAADDAQWHVYNVTANHGIPASAVLEVACVNEYNIAEYRIGLRETASSGEADWYRRIQLAEAEDGDNYVIMHVQLDSSGCLQYYLDYYNRLHFDILGYWLGVEYVEKGLNAWKPTAASGWEGKNLSDYGVGSGQIAEIIVRNDANANDRTIGIRPSGDAFNRFFDIKEAEGGGEEAASLFVNTVGSGAAIEIWASDVDSNSFKIAGYFTSPPGDYTETDVVFPAPGSQATWVELDVGASGIPSGTVAQFHISQEFADNISVGVRATDGTASRLLEIDRKDADVGSPSVGSIHSSVDADGKLEYYCNDISDQPYYKVIGYWDNFNFSSIPFPFDGNIDLYIYGSQLYAHYIEDFYEFSAPDAKEWTSVDVSEAMPTSAGDEPIVAEVLLRNLSHKDPVLVGVREDGSSIDRQFVIHESEEKYTSVESISIHVNVSSTGTFEVFTDNLSYGLFRIVGWWIGGTYVEKFENFSSSSSADWSQVNLDTYSVPQNSIVEILISNDNQTDARFGGVRQLDATLDRKLDIASLIENYGATWAGQTFFTMFCATYPDTDKASIEVYAEDKDDIDFYLVGYWSNPPGDYVELDATDIGLNATERSWNVDSLIPYGVPANSVAEMIVANTDYTNDQLVGVRESGSNLERFEPFAETNEAGGVYMGLCGDRMQVNTLDGSIESYHFRPSGYYYYGVFGYWTNLRVLQGDKSRAITLCMSGEPGFISTSGTKGGQYPSGVSLNMHGAQIGPQCDLFIDAYGAENLSADLFTHGIYFFKTDDEFSTDYPSGLLCYTAGSGIIPHSGQFDLYTLGIGNHNISTDLFAEGCITTIASGNLFMSAPEQVTDSIDLYVCNIVDPGPGLIRESDAIFYIKNYEDTNLITEHIEEMDWYIPGIYFADGQMIGDNTATSTVGDGTLPEYNSLGLGVFSNANGSALTSTQPLRQNFLGLVVDDQTPYTDLKDYPFAGSGSITTAFWMSGAHTPSSGSYGDDFNIGTGVMVEAGWFNRSGRFAAGAGELGNAYPIHTVGVEIKSQSGIVVHTSVKDVEYDQASGTGPWWGGTTHYGTPSGDDWTWNTEVDAEYHTWSEEWPEVTIEHGDVAFFVVRSEFVPSGLDGDAPNHMKVWLSVDGQPWVYIGSGLTGPPASSLYSYSDPYNRYAERGVGLRLRGNNYAFGEDNCTVGLSEAVLWSDTDKFTSAELAALHSVVDTYNRPLDEYRPTVLPPSTYIQRTVGPAIYEPLSPSGNYHAGEIGSGMLVTLNVRLGAYGEDASAYLLEEVPPSGFYVRNISPAEVTYPDQGTRPATRQQIFNDPQSGIMQPRPDGWANTYGASIRWVHHNNHPEKDQRRTPLPSAVYTYELYPVKYPGIAGSDDFAFSGSGSFFGGSTGSGIFVVETTGETSGTTSGVVGGTIFHGIDCFISGPESTNDSVNLYLRTQESFTSAYIGTASRTPELTDFVFAADGAAAIETMAGIEYGPSLYTKGPLPYEDSCDLFLLGPISNYFELFTHGSESFNSSGTHPSGLPLSIPEAHESVAGSGDLVILGPVPASGDIGLYTQAGSFDQVDLVGIGHLPYSGSVSGFTKGPEFTCTSGSFEYPLDSSLFTNPSGGQSPDLYIKGPEFICSSGSFAYPYDIDDFTHPYGDLSPPLFTWGFEDASGNCPLYIGPLRVHDEWTLYLKTDANTKTSRANLFTHGYSPASGVSGVYQTFDNRPLYLEAADADYPYTAGGTDSWTLFMKAQSGNLTGSDAWTLFLKADQTVNGSSNLYTYGHASGSPPHGNVYTSSVYMICSANPSDPTRIGFIPTDTHDDPWTLFLKCDPGHFGTTNLYISGAAPTTLFASGNLFVEGLFEQITDNTPLYMMGVSGLINNGPSGVALFLDAGTLVYNTSGNLYVHGY